MKNSSYTPSTPISQEARSGCNSRYAHWSCISAKYPLPRGLKLSKVLRETNLRHNQLSVSMRCFVPSNHCKILIIWGFDCPGFTSNALRFFLLFSSRTVPLKRIRKTLFWTSCKYSIKSSLTYKNRKARSAWRTRSALRQRSFIQYSNTGLFLRWCIG